jgi:hypothetical protein
MTFILCEIRLYDLTVHNVIVKLKNLSGRVEVVIPSLCIEEIEGNLTSVLFFSTRNINEDEFTAIRFFSEILYPPPQFATFGLNALP